MNFYVTCINGKQVALLVGPCKTHDEALGWVALAREAAVTFDPYAHFYEYGTSSVESEQRGVFNTHVMFD